MTTPAKNTVCLWYDGGAEEAARFYAATFPDSSVGAVHRAPGDFPSGRMGDVLTVEFTVMGIPCLGLNGGPAFTHDEAFSFQVATTDQAETDRYWTAIVGNGGRESACGWCENRLADPDRISASDYLESIESLGRGWVVESNGEIVAFAVGYRSGNIWALFVHPDHEGRGHGRALHSEMIGWLWSLGLLQLWLTTAPGSRAERFYESLGWQQRGRVAGGDVRLELDRPSSTARGRP